MTPSLCTDTNPSATTPDARTAAESLRIPYTGWLSVLSLPGLPLIVRLLVLPRIPRVVLVSVLHEGYDRRNPDLGLNYMSDSCRLYGIRARPLFDALSATLRACDAPGVPSAPGFLMLYTREGGALDIGPPGGELYCTVAAEDTARVRLCLARAIAWRALQPRPWYERTESADPSPRCRR